MRCGVVCRCELFITTFLVVLITEAVVYFKDSSVVAAVD